jgi:ribosomal protein S18 acetylase RimI-like enzyme
MGERSVRIDAGPDRDAYLSFLLLADDAEQLVLDYYQTGDLYAFELDSEVVGTVLVTGTGPTREFKSVAVAEQRQGQGIGQRIVRQAIDEMRESGVKRLELMTGNCGVGQIAFYQKVGFRLLRIDRDWFTPARGYAVPIHENGILLRDAVWFDLDLTANSPVP